jgi:hypothetical protein
MRSVDPTVENLSADPAHFIPALAFIIESIETICDSSEDTSRIPRVLPFPHFDEVEEDGNMDIDNPYEGFGSFKRQMKKKGRDLGPSYFNMEIDFIF